MAKLKTSMITSNFQSDYRIINRDEFDDNLKKAPGGIGDETH